MLVSITRLKPSTLEQITQVCSNEIQISTTLVWFLQIPEYEYTVSSNFMATCGERQTRAATPKQLDFI